MKRHFKTYGSIFVLTLSLVFPALSNAADDAKKSDTSSIKQELKKDTGISDKDLSAIDSELKNYVQNNGDPNQAKELVSSSLSNNCTGDCLKQAFAGMNTAMNKGISNDEAQNIVAESLREQVRQRGPGQVSEEDMAKNLKASVENKIQERQQTGTAPGMSDSQRSTPGGGGASSPGGSPTGGRGGY